MQTQAPGSARTATYRINPWRTLRDKLATLSISAGGMGVLVAILLIFFYLLYEILPLFQGATIERRATFPVATLASAESPTLYLAMEEYGEIALRISADGVAQFFRSADGSNVLTETLPTGTVPVSSFAQDSETSRLFALGLEDGRVLVAQHDYRISYPDDQRHIAPRISYPYGSAPFLLTDAGPVRHLAVRDSDAALVVVGSSGGGRLYGRQWVKAEDFLSGDITVEERVLNVPDVDIKVSRLLLGPDQRWLYAFSKAGDFRVLDLREGEVVDSGRLFSAGSLVSSRLLLGGISVMVANDRGLISQWFMVNRSGEVPSFERVRDFRAATAVSALAVEHRRKGFVTVDAQGQLDIYYATSERHALREQVSDSGAVALAMGPRGDALLVESQGGEVALWSIHNPHPEVSWRALWGKVWYESYPAPDYVWQSSSGSSDFEPKLSLSPLAFGTLKAAFYAMLIATPLAICGAIYTAYFMAPALRRKVKPLIETMEALPTVILGFLAGLWLAPFVEENLPGIFSILLLMPFAVLLFGYLWNTLPVGLRRYVPDGWQPLLLVPAVILTCWLCVAISPVLESMFFGGDMRIWLTNDLGVDFDQRNALVVGLAMGFAVIPTIFSIAEDALFSVPKHLSYGSLALGATPWQTLVGVVIPTASPGIFSALMIGMGRAVGETMIVLMATGNTPIMDANIFEGMRTLAANIAVEIGETEVASTHFRVLFLAGFVLFMFTFMVNTVAEVVRQRLRKRYGSL